MNVKFSDTDRLGITLRVPDATAACGLSPTPCLDIIFPGFMPSFFGGVVSDIHIPCVVWRSVGVHAKLYV